MYPGMLHWWRMRRRAACKRGDEAFANEGGEGDEESVHRGEHHRHGGRHGPHDGHHDPHGHGPGHGGGEEFARILDELKTERAQAAVDDRRTTAAFADALGLEKFDDAKALEGGTLRVRSAERLRDAVLKALAKIHATLDQAQRAQLGCLIHTGTLSIQSIKTDQNRFASQAGSSSLKRWGPAIAGGATWGGIKISRSTRAAFRFPAGPAPG